MEYVDVFLPLGSKPVTLDGYKCRYFTREMWNERPSYNAKYVYAPEYPDVVALYSNYGINPHPSLLRPSRKNVDDNVKSFETKSKQVEESKIEAAAEIKRVLAEKGLKPSFQAQDEAVRKGEQKIAHVSDAETLATGAEPTTLQESRFKLPPGKRKKLEAEKAAKEAATKGTAAKKAAE